VIKHFIEYEKNFSLNDYKSKICPTLLLGSLSEIRNSYIHGNFHLDNYSSINRCEINIGSAVGVHSYLSDTKLDKYSIIGSRVSIGSFEHPTDWLSHHGFQWGQGIEHWETHTSQGNKKTESKPSPEQTYLGPDTWVGNNAVVLSKVRIESGSIIGAGSVVTKDTHPYSVNVGNPARLVGYRFEKEIIDQLLMLKWWDLDFEEISKLTFSKIDIALKQIMRLRGL